MRLDRNRVRTLMRQRDIQWFRELAAEVGVTPQAMSAWWGGAMPEWGTLEKLCSVLDCTLDDIIVQDAPKEIAPAVAA